ncbi:conserved hypothetical protein [Candidatus Zixiibacteriota bacterium]|nr:conserved hypothetical protein [candidate division Zixibacteria bacterium]
MVLRRRLQKDGPSVIFVTTTVADWKPIFSNETNADICLNQLNECLSFFDVSLIGYVLMPDHLHLLLALQEARLISKFMQRFKGLTSVKIKEIRNIINNGPDQHTFRLWRPRFDDIIIVSEEQFRIKLNYIHQNPVRAGLVLDEIDWKYSSARDWLSDRAGPLRIDKDYEWTR